MDAAETQEDRETEEQHPEGQWNDELDDEELVEDDGAEPAHSYSNEYALSLSQAQPNRAQQTQPQPGLQQQQQQQQRHQQPRPAVQPAAWVETRTAASASAAASAHIPDFSDDLGAESLVESQLLRLDHALEVQKLKDEVKRLRDTSDHRELFGDYEATIASLTAQNATLRARLSKAEGALSDDNKSVIRNPAHHRGQDSSQDLDSAAPTPAMVARYRVLESSYRRASEELAELHQSHSALRKRERMFTFQTKQLHTLEARLTEQAATATKREKELQAARSKTDSIQAANEELKTLVFELSNKHAAEVSRAQKHQERAESLRGEMERLAAALHDAKAAAVLAKLKPASGAGLPKRGASLASPAASLRFDGSSDFSELESLFLETRRADTPPNLIHSANRKGIDLLSRLRTKVEALQREHVATQTNEKSLLMLVIKMQEKKQQG